MFEVTGLKCLRCDTVFPSKTLFNGCPRCSTTSLNSNVNVVYEVDKNMSPASSLSLDDRSMWRYRTFLGVQKGEVSLGEGLTPMIMCESLASELGVDTLYLKNESMSPTCSYKDRLASASVTRAIHERAIGVATSSTGNHGASTAAYAARAGFDCIIFTVKSIPEAMRFQMLALGAMLVATDNYKDRWHLLRYCVEELGWYSTGNFSNPPVGSSPYGIEGYKTIAYEIAETLDWNAPDVVVMPVAYGDGIRGVFKGFQDLVAVGWIPRIPRMVAVETGGSLTMAINKGLDSAPELSIGPSVALSIHTPASSFQALKTIRDSGGTAVHICDSEILHAQKNLGFQEGIFIEPASAAVIAGIAHLAREGGIAGGETVVGVLTSTGLKYPQIVSEYCGEIPVIGPDPTDLKPVLENVYDYELCD